jgi:hypothetical protein
VNEHFVSRPQLNQPEACGLLASETGTFVRDRDFVVPIRLQAPVQK